MGSPTTFMMRPSVSAPTGIEMGAPEDKTPCQHIAWSTTLRTHAALAPLSYIHISPVSNTTSSFNAIRDTIRQDTRIRFAKRRSLRSTGITTYRVCEWFIERERRQRETEVGNGLATDETVSGVQGNATHHVVTQVLSNLEGAAVLALLHLEAVENAGQLTILEDNVEDGTHDLN